MWAWLSSLYIAAVVIQLTLALRVVSPWIMADELIYSDMARSFAETGRFRNSRRRRELRLRLSAPHLARIRALRFRRGCVRRSSRRERARDLLGRPPGVSPRSPRREHPRRVRRCRVRGRGSADDLCGNADDGERVLSDLRVGRLRARPCSRAADTSSTVAPAGAVRPRVQSRARRPSRSLAPCSPRRSFSRGSSAAGRGGLAPGSHSTVSSQPARVGRVRRAARAGPVALRHSRRLQRHHDERVLSGLGIGCAGSRTTLRRSTLRSG